jgi:DnaK suppressor protein
VAPSQGTAIRAKDLACYRKVLLAKAAEVRARLSAECAAEFVRPADGPLDFGDWCDKNREEWLFVNRNRLEVELLRELEAALKRLAEGEFGSCQRCAQPISAERLRALPWARFCLRCQEKQTAAAAG